MKSVGKLIGLAAIFTFLLFCNPILADEDRNGWVDVKIGTADSNAIVALQFNYTENDKLYALTSRYGSNLLERRDYRELSIAYGKRLLHRFGTTTVHAGVGLAELDDRFLGHKIEPVIPLVASFTFGKYLGVSATATLNINRIEPFIGVELGIALGQFR